MEKILALNEDLTVENFHTHLLRPEYASFFASAPTEEAGTAGKHLKGSGCFGGLDDAKNVYDTLVCSGR